MDWASIQVAMIDVSIAILDNSFKTSTPFIDTVINETLREFFPLGDYRSLQLFQLHCLTAYDYSIQLLTAARFWHNKATKSNYVCHSREPS